MDNASFLARPRSVREISEYLGVRDVFVWNQIAIGKLVARRLGTKCLRVLPEDIKRWLDNAATKPGPASAQFLPKSQRRKARLENEEPIAAKQEVAA
jgi:helix-turn-helix protein